MPCAQRSETTVSDGAAFLYYCCVPYGLAKALVPVLLVLVLLLRLTRPGNHKALISVVVRRG